MINLPMSEMVEMIKEVVSTDGEFRLYPRGTSMLPLIVEGKDSVILARPSLLCVGDIVLYKRENGQYVLHRIVKMKGDNLFLCGDNQTDIETGITTNDVIAKAIAVYKGDIRFEGNTANVSNYLFKLKLKRIFKPTLMRIKRVMKDPTLIWRKLRREK